MPQNTRTVTVIPQKKNTFTHTPIEIPVKRKVAGYARVSTDSEEQLTSYEAQVDYYTRYIHSKPEWEFVNVYTDEGISATNTKRREGFNRMIADALAGKIDLIVTKSVSRFARNTVDSLTAVRKLKEHGTEVYFEKENIWTFDSKGELLITIMSSLAQEESRSISENVTWGQRKRFADGNISLPYSSFLGYKKGTDGLPEIVPEEAQIVKRIYKMFIEGKTVNAIARQLTAEKIPTPRGKTNWQTSTIESILTNEKYKGSAILQKKFTVDFLSKKMKINEGEVPQYRVENSHPAIINSEEWEQVQIEMKHRKSQGRHHNSLSPFSGKILCGDCGEYYGSKVWHSNSKYKRTIWQCNGKFKGENKCRTPHLYEDEIKRLFILALSKLVKNQDLLIDDCRYLRKSLTDNTEIDNQCTELSNEAEVISQLIEKLISDNASTAMNQEEYFNKYNDLVKKYNQVQTKYEKLLRQKDKRLYQADLISGFMFEIQELTLLPIAFDDKLWNATINFVKVYEDEKLEFAFKNGAKITEILR